MVNISKKRYDSLNARSRELGSLKKEYSRGKFIFRCVLTLLLIVLLFWGAGWLFEKFKNAGPDINLHNVALSGKLATFFGWFGISSATTAEALIIYAAVFIIIFVALKDIIEGFSTFEGMSAWIIAGALALITAVGRGVSYIVGMFEMTGAIGAAGIAIIIFTAIVAAVVLNLGMGSSLQAWVFQRKMLKETYRTAEGAEETSNSIRGLRKVNESFREGVQ